MKRMNTFYLFIVLLLIIPVTVLGISSPYKMKGQPAPDFTLTDVITGKEVSLKETIAQNKVTMVHFWGTWCKPCVAEFPELIKFYNDFGTKKVAFLAVACYDNLREVKEFALINEVQFPVFTNYKGDVAEMYGVSGFPSTIVIDYQGMIRDFYLGSRDAETYGKAATHLIERADKETVIESSSGDNK